MPRRDDDNDYIYGFRQSRYNTTYEHRHPSSLSPAQTMEQEMYYVIAENFTAQAHHVAALTAGVYHVYNRYLTSNITS